MVIEIVVETFHRVIYTLFCRLGDIYGPTSAVLWYSPNVPSPNYQNIPSYYGSRIIMYNGLGARRC